MRSILGCIQSKSRTRVIAALVLSVAAFHAVAAHAHQSPANCNGNSFFFSLERAPSTIVLGGRVVFSVMLGNLDDPSISLVACDVDDVDVAFFCPGSDGSPDFANPIIISTNLSLPAGTQLAIAGNLTCIIDVDPGVVDAVAAIRAGDQGGPLDNLAEGILHDAAVDHPFRADKFLGTEVTIIDPPPPQACRNGQMEGTEQCDNGPLTGTASSCCTLLECQFEQTGRLCTIGVCNGIDPCPIGICDGAGTCVLEGTCGNGIGGEVSRVAGTLVKEECDLGAGNTEDVNADSCCNPDCTRHEANTVCRYADHTCVADSVCPPLGDGTCPDGNTSSRNQSPCVGAQCFEAGVCQNGECVPLPQPDESARICNAEVRVDKLNKFVPDTLARCDALGSATSAPNATCDVTVTRQLHARLSPNGRRLFRDAALRAPGTIRAASTACVAAARQVIEACGTGDLDAEVTLCVNAQLRVGAEYAKCTPPTPCSDALVALGERCPRAVKKSGSLKENVVAIVNGLIDSAGAPIRGQRQTRMCKKKRKCS